MLRLVRRRKYDEDTAIMFFSVGDGDLGVELFLLIVPRVGALFNGKEFFVRRV